MYTTGNKLKIDLFGKSHGDCVGCTVTGLPKGMKIDETYLKSRMDLRRPSSIIGTERREDDDVIFDSGVKDLVITDDEITIKIPNKDFDPSAYTEFDSKPRPGHADLPALMKFKDHHIDGGAQFSGRMTAPLVAVGALAQQFLAEKDIRIAAYTKQIHCVVDDKEHTFKEIASSEEFKTRAVGKLMDKQMADRIVAASMDGDSVGGVVCCMITGLPIGFGGLWFDALDVSLAKMMFAIPGVKGVGFGKGFAISAMKGSLSNDQYHVKKKSITSTTNNMGGICGGLSNGLPVVFDVAFKPTPSISKEQTTVDLKTMKETKISIKGRHDPCIVPRAVSVVEAMAAITVLDQYLSEKEE